MGGVWRMAYGVWRMAYGVWRMAYGVWRMAYGNYINHQFKYQANIES